MLATITACSGAHHQSAPATTTTLPPGAITVDRWTPPALSGPASETNFCAALTAIYRHMAELPHVVSRTVSEQYLGDYVNYASTVRAEAPADIKPSADLYVGAVAVYLQKLSAAGLQLGKLPAGSLQTLSSAPVNAAYTSLSGYSTTNCHYTIGGQVGG